MTSCGGCTPYFIEDTQFPFQPWFGTFPQFTTSWSVVQYTPGDCEFDDQSRCVQATDTVCIAKINIAVFSDPQYWGGVTLVEILVNGQVLVSVSHDTTQGPINLSQDVTYAGACGSEDLIEVQVGPGPTLAQHRAKGTLGCTSCGNMPI